MIATCVIFDGFRLFLLFVDVNLRRCWARSRHCTRLLPRGCRYHHHHHLRSLWAVSRPPPPTPHPSGIAATTTVTAASGPTQTATPARPPIEAIQKRPNPHLVRLLLLVRTSPLALSRVRRQRQGRLGKALGDTPLPDRSRVYWRTKRRATKRTVAHRIFSGEISSSRLLWKAPMFFLWDACPTAAATSITV